MSKLTYINNDVHFFIAVVYQYPTNHADSSQGMGIVISSFCYFVSLAPSVSAVKGEWLDQSTPKLVDIKSVAGP